MDRAILPTSSSSARVSSPTAAGGSSRSAPKPCSAAAMPLEFVQAASQLAGRAWPEAPPGAVADRVGAWINRSARQVMSSAWATVEVKLSTARLTSLDQGRGGVTGGPRARRSRSRCRPNRVSVSLLSLGYAVGVDRAADRPGSSVTAFLAELETLLDTQRHIARGLEIAGAVRAAHQQRRVVAADAVGELAGPPIDRCRRPEVRNRRSSLPSQSIRFTAA